ncbi:MAG: Na(+)/H(+) antiporter subunit B [Syntrophomonas sp.]|nr:Na(+)/H(+) antiporter subunit B [Syntrophomonas sp.]
MKTHSMILLTVTRVVVFVIMIFAVQLFLMGHSRPGGGFVGGLAVAAAVVLLYLAADVKTVQLGIPLDFKVLALTGVLIAVATGMGSLIFGQPFLSHAFGHFALPLFGSTELTTVVIFDTGVGLAVLGTALTIIDTISEDISEDICRWKR